MKYKIIALLVTSFVIIGNSFSQNMTNLEKKKLRKEIRKMIKNPSKYKNLKESIEVNKTIVNEQSLELDQINKAKNKLRNQLEIARDSIGDYAYAIKVYKESEEKAKEEPKSNSILDNSGMKYRLQIGLYKDFDISNFLEQLKVISFEKTENGLFRYTIGNFETEYDAELFKSALREMGIKDAFVSYYLEGSRIAKD